MRQNIKEFSTVQGTWLNTSVAVTILTCEQLSNNIVRIVIGQVSQLLTHIWDVM